MTRLPATATLRLAPQPIIADLDALIDMGENFVGDAVVLVSEQEHGRRPSGRQTHERCCAVGELDGDDALAGRALLVQPRLLARCDPVEARPPAPKRVADLKRVPVMPRARHRKARADGVARAQQGAEVGVVGDPERSDDEVVPATVARRTALCSKLIGLGLRAAHGRAFGTPEVIIQWRLSAAAPVHRRVDRGQPVQDR